MLLMSEIPESTFLFHVFQDRKAFGEFSVNERDIITSQDLPGFKDKTLSIVLNRDGNRIRAEFSKPVMVNGVECRSKKLKKGDLLRLGPYRLIYEGEKPAEKVEQVLPEPGVVRPKKAARVKKIPSRKKTRPGKQTGKRKKQPSIALFIEAAAVLSSLFFLWFCSTQNPARKAPLHTPPEVTVVREHEAPPPAEKEGKKPGVKPEQPAQKPSGTLLTYVPGEMPGAEKLDILFIHAHPDDETLDYGLSIALSAERGLKAGVLTFTDGESGFDYYPDRDITGIYPDRELSGKALADVRVQEEANSLRILGAFMYIRLGLKNRPYIKEEASKPIPELIDEWGGREFLIDKLTDVFSRLSPDIIISPDGPSGAKEHFEHEAVGYIAGLAVSEYQSIHPGMLKAYLKLVDPGQREAYPGKVLLTVKAEGASFGIILKKKAALAQYQTQADACYYGLRRLKRFPEEYYFSVFTKESAKIALLQNSYPE